MVFTLLEDKVHFSGARRRVYKWQFFCRQSSVVEDAEKGSRRRKVRCTLCTNDVVVFPSLLLYAACWTSHSVVVVVTIHLGGRCLEKM